MLPLVAKELDLTSAVTQLGNPEYNKREAASHYLLSNASLDEVEALRDHEDPEVRHRIRKIIQSMQSGITANTPMDIVTLVHEFQEAEPARKAKILIDLKNKEAYLQIFALSAQLGDDPAYASIQQEVARLTPSAVKHYMENKNADLALKILDFTEATPENCRMWAFIISQEGLTDEKLSKLLIKESLSDRAKARVLALYRTEDDHTSAAKWAERIEHDSYLAGQSLLKGDLETFIKWGREQLDTALPDPDYTEAVMLRAKGDIQALSDYENLFSDNAKIGEIERLHSILQLAASGDLETSFKLMTKEEKKNQTFYLSGRADIKTTLSLYGLEYGNPLPEKWIIKQNQANQNGLWFNPNQSDSQTIIGVLEALGDFDSLHELFLPQWERIKDEEGNKYEILQQLAQLSSKESVYKITSKMPQEELEELEKALKSANGISGYCYDLSKDVFPDKSIPERVDFILAVINAEIKTQVLDGEINQFIQAVERDCLEHPEDLKREDRLALLYQLIGHKQKLYKYIQSRYMAEPSFERAGQMLMQYLIFDEWEKAANHVLTYENKGQRNELELDLHKCTILKKGGREEEEQELLERLLSKFLDHPARYRNSAALYQAIGLQNEALSFLERGLSVTNPDEHNFYYWQEFLKLGLVLYTKNQQHHLAALCGEVLLLKSLSNISASSKLTDSFASGNNFYALADLRFKTDLCWIKHFASIGKETAARQLAARIADQWIANGVLADEFYPILRQLGYHDILEKSLNESFNHYLTLVEDYPQAYNHMNTAAWLASRAVMRLSEATELIEKALEHEPRNHAFLDTRAEVYFANGDRKNALEHSLRAWQDSLLQGNDPLIKQQYYHFKNDPLPVKK